MPEPEVVAVSQDRLDETVEVLAESFFNYPTMRYVLRSSGASYPTRLREFVHYLCGARFRHGNPVLGIELGDPMHMVAAALVDGPGHQEADDGATGEDGRGLSERIGAEAVGRLREFNDAITPLEPDVDFYYLGMVGVLSGYRGRGFSRLLMDRVVDMSSKDPDSSGVLLTTEQEANVALYESMGFEILGEAHTADRRLYSWTMFRGDD